MTTGAPGTAPDVSGVLLAAHKAYCNDTGCFDGDDISVSAIQQAAEQACYRYALSVVGRIGCSGACVPLVRCLACREKDELKQLIAGSA